MKKNGFTTIELLVCFIVISAISVSMFGVVMHYKESQQVESIRSDLLTYKYNLTKTIQDDLIKIGVESVTYNQLTSITFTFKDHTTKTLSVDRDQYLIHYGDTDYPLPNIDGLEIDQGTYFLIEPVDTTTFVTIRIPFVHPDLENRDYALFIVHPYTNTL